MQKKMREDMRLSLRTKKVIIIRTPKKGVYYLF